MTGSRLGGLTALVLLAGAAFTTPARAQVPKHNCAWCHDLHGGSYAALGSYATSQALCESCHGEAGPATVLRDGVTVTVPKNVVIHDGARHTTPTSCWSCHDHEGESAGNLKMIPTSRTAAALGLTRTVVFTALSGSKSYADGDATYDGVCEVCHTATTQHRYDGSTSKHNAAANCSTCHKHSGAFSGAGGRCTSCHNQVQNARRIITTEFSRLSHHVTGYAVADSIPDADCTMCHDQSTHQQGQVRLRNVDGGASIVLTGDPNTVNAEAAKLETFCLACHDTNGANGDLTPFSNNVTRPLVNSTSWTAASHSTSSGVPAGCYKDCHASGHGSAKRMMLAPAATAAVSPALAEEQEGFCFNCHDSDGPATSNLATPFGTTIKWITAVVAGKTGLLLNDRHDVQHTAQTTSGAKIECRDCHDPHSATDAQPWKTDPDPNDGRVPGTGQVMAGVTKLSEFCLDCHDGSFPTTVVGPTRALTNVRTTHTTDAMGAGSGSASLKTGYGWIAGDVMNCKACHVPHVSSNLFNAVPTVYSKDGLTPVPTTGGGAYSITNNNIKTTSINGWKWCNTCHDNSMGSAKTNCFECHYHGTRW